MQLSKFLPKKFSTRLTVMTFIAGLIPIIIFAILLNIFHNQILTEINHAIRQGQEEQWQRNEAILKQMAENSIRRKVLDVSLQLELYLQSHPDMTVQNLQNDNEEPLPYNLWVKKAILPSMIPIQQLTAFIRIPKLKT